jgi:hypothetical protein
MLQPQPSKATFVHGNHQQNMTFFFGTIKASMGLVVLRTKGAPFGKRTEHSGAFCVQMKSIRHPFLMFKKKRKEKSLNVSS